MPEHVVATTCILLIWGLGAAALTALLYVFSEPWHRDDEAQPPAEIERSRVSAWLKQRDVRRGRARQMPPEPGIIGHLHHEGVGREA